MNKKLGAVIAVIVIVLAGVLVYVLGNHPSATNNSSPSTSSSAQSASGTAFTVNATDDNADVTTLNVKKGDAISVTFNVKDQGVYHGGLEFKSDVVSSGPIKPGESKTVTFTADKSFDFTPYWYQSNIKKDYVVSVKVD